MDTSRAMVISLGQCLSIFMQQEDVRFDLMYLFLQVLVFNNLMLTACSRFRRGYLI